MSVDYARLAVDAGGSEAQGRDYAALAKESGAVVDPNTSKAALDKQVTNEDFAPHPASPAGVFLRAIGRDRIPGTGGFNQFMIATGRGMVDLWEGTNQVARIGADIVSPRQTKLTDIIPGGANTRNADYTREAQEGVDQFKKLEKEAPITAGTGRIVGQVAPTLAVPGGWMEQVGAGVSRLPMLGFMARAGAGTEAGVMGGLQALLNFTPEEESRGGHVSESAAVAVGLTKALGFAGRLAAPLVRRGVEWFGEKVGDSSLATMAGTKAGTTADDIATGLKKEGIDWSTLPQDVREGVKALADDAAKAGAPVTPAELARVVRAQKLPGGSAELTKGQMTQDRSQLRSEFDLRRTSAGKSLDDQLMQQDAALANSLDVIKLKTGGATTAGREADAGQKITKPLLDQLKAAQGKVDQLYKVADESGETLTKVDPTPLLKWVEDNFAAMHSAPAMKSLVADLKKSGLVTFSEDGVATAGREPTIREVEALRQAMVKWGKADGASGAYMGEAKRVLDGITEGKGGELYAKARAARIELRNQFEDPGVINRLVSEKPGGDRITAFEDVFKKSVIDSSVDDLTRLRAQLLQGAGDDPKLQGAGVRAFKDMRAAALDYIKMGAMNNAKDEFSYAGLKKAVDSIGAEKLEVLFGKNTANQILQVVESAKDMKAGYNKTGIYNPGTASALVEWLDRISGIVGLGKAGTYGRIYASGAAKKIMETLAQPKAVEEASKPVAGVMRAGEKLKDDAYRELMGLYAGKAGAMAAPAVGAAVSTSGGEQ